MPKISLIIGLAEVIRTGKNNHKHRLKSSFRNLLLYSFFLFHSSGMLIVSFFALCSSELPFKLVDSQINTAVSIFTSFGNNEDLTVFAPCNYLHAGTSTLIAVDNHFNLIDTIVVFWKLGSLLLGMFSHGFRYVDMFASNSKKQNRSP
jgi:hypothetical protein